ncbi:nuclear transport factor 2 family protein [Sediminicola luteus]|uniref:DUF4440 domain-containing protein n=1 Tax=Sediminicola luteus TaxID=319238 RepID=A0A2A4G1R5_9FLAO|nr:nuclear transport factor 2 family protein [Sediminicola luteus]PCE62627.1 DUF4440 domain-containing protein [Sediminicola luteus]
MKTIIPPFTADSAAQKVQLAEDAWNTKNPAKVALAYTPDSEWRNRNQFFSGRKSIEKFLTQKWNKEKHYKLKKHLWSYTDNRISVRFEYEWYHEETDQWYRTHGNEHWQFNADGLMEIRDMSANDVKITAEDRLF